MTSTSSFEYSWMNSYKGIQLEQQILHKFVIDWELIILTAMVLQLKDP